MTGQSRLQTPTYSLPQQSILQTQAYGLSPSTTQAQVNALQAYSFLAQLDGAAQTNAIQMQLAALQQNALALQQSGQLSPSQFRLMRQQQRSLSKELQSAQTDALQQQIDGLNEYIQLEQAAGNLTSSQLRSLRKQVATLTRQLRILRSQSGS